MVIRQQPSERTELEQARARMANLARMLGHKFGCLDAAGTLVGCAVTLMIAQYGKDGAAKYFRDLSELIELDGDDVAGHA